MCLATLAVVGAVTSAVGTVSSSIASSNAADYQATVAGNNAKAARDNSEYAIAAGEKKAEAQSLKGAAAGGRIKTAQAANGVNVNTGSAVDVQEGQREAAGLDTATVMDNASLQAYGYRTAADNFEGEKSLKEAESENDLTAGGLKAAGGLLSSASSLGMKWSPSTGDSTFQGNPWGAESGNVPTL